MLASRGESDPQNSRRFYLNFSMSIMNKGPGRSRYFYGPIRAREIFKGTLEGGARKRNGGLHVSMAMGYSKFIALGFAVVEQQHEGIK